MNFTIDQSKAIDTHGKNIIVSAGAGSGKTAVLTERIYKMLLDGTDISRLLVLTFTNAAALEMKTRIKKRVLESGLLPDQVEKIDSAFITTFDSFSLSLVKKYHYILSISKNISIIDASVVSLRKKEILDNIFEEIYLEKEEGFVDILTKFTHKSDDDIKKSILNIAGKVDKIVDKEEYLNTYSETYYCDEYLNRKIKNFVNEVNERKRDMLLKAHELYDATIGTSCGESVAELIDFITSTE
jgi:ATP-dependent helicase/nuclease subunit A